ncbi:hypothetical protein [Pseudomonas prosekii]|uniref:hypothetical protein n=1 Tax=Pseudomonas prosekii TaxID=1148509 RepID=UPI0011EB5D35|nr:hypothetical protein [Pseudomonas prosekii]
MAGVSSSQRRFRGYTRHSSPNRAHVMAPARRNGKKLSPDALIRTIASSTAIETGQSVEEIERKLKNKSAKFAHLNLAQ